MPEPLVRFADVRKSYDGRTLVVKRLDLDIERGEFLTLLGPSGSGKTTCLMMLAGFEPPTAGEIFLEGRPITRVPAYKRGVGVVFQNYALFPHMTIADNLGFPLKVRGVPRAERMARVARALDMVQLPGYEGRRPAQLSGGQQQRVAVARALVFEPTIILMDEPLGALDKQLREQMQYEVKHLHQRLGLTVLYVTHDQSEALTMSDRIAVFNHGVIQQLAAPPALYEAPENAFVAGFIGENNRLSGTVTSLRADGCTVALDTGDLVDATPVGIEVPGIRIVLSVRPERVVVNPDARAGQNRFTGQVLELVYLGDHLRIRIATCGREDFVAKVPNTQRRAPLHAGDRVTVGWQREDCRALRTDPAP